MEPRPVEVLHAGRWHPGWVRSTRQEPDGRWRGLLTFTVAPGESYYRWEWQDVVRPRDYRFSEGTSGPAAQSCAG